jgi:hypothetical protein
MLGESEGSGDDLPEVTPTAALENQSSSSSSGTSESETSSEEQEEEEKEIDAMLAQEEDANDPDKNVRFANDEIVGDSDEEDLVDDDEESID